MNSFILFVDRVTSWAGKAFGWCILIMTFGMAYEVFVRYLLRDPTSWAFDFTYMMYGTLFMMAGAYTLSRDGHVRGDVVYRLWPARTQATIELILYFIFFFPGVLALIFAGADYASESWFYKEVSVMSPANVPIFQLNYVFPI
ncbi:MAG: TRAP transporter small permease subunit, partial [Hyphomicrobiales bacterium]